MHWWDEAEARAHRAKTPAAAAQTLQQRLLSAGLDADLAFVPAYDLAQLYDLCADFVKLVESLLVAADGDRPAIRRHSLALARWARSAAGWVQASGPGFNQLLDSLDLDAGQLAEREVVAGAAAEGLPEEQPKVEGRYQRWHLLYERLDLKLASALVEERARRGLARSLARIYEQALLTLRAISGLEKEAAPRFRATARMLLEINTAWHFDLGPYHLGHGDLRPRGQLPPGLQTWLLLAFS
ncbi:MAG TPA: hypothetical protein VD902_20035 [Symbiobacteriaceae bacterium]|nr:hypothetical protein [Symbiobacteriaceae bacterium]